MLPTTKFSIIAIHAAVPTVRLIRPGYETTVAGWRENPLHGLMGLAKRDKLIRLGLLASQRSLTPTLDMDDWWSKPMPVCRRTRAVKDSSDTQKELFLRNTDERELLRGLVLAAAFRPDLEQFAVCRTNLEQWSFPKSGLREGYLGEKVSDLKLSLRPWVSEQLQTQFPQKYLKKPEDGIQDDAARRRAEDAAKLLNKDSARLCKDTIDSQELWCAQHQKDERFYYLDARQVRVDWFEVLGACETAALEKNRYQQAHAWFVAEQAYVRSAQRTAGEDRDELAELNKIARDLNRASRDLNQQRDIDQAEKVVRRRWGIRRQYLAALRMIEHSDRMVMEYRQWRRRAGLNGFDKGEPRDDFYGLDVVAPLEELGTVTLPNGTSLSKAAEDRRPGVPSVPDPALEDLGTRLDSALAGGGQVDVDWSEMRLLTIELTRQLADARGQRIRGSDPLLPVFDLVIAVGRGGALLATAMCQVLGVRLMGTMAMSRYADPDTAKGTTPYIRGVELPVVNARRVLVCDDVIKSGVTIGETALKVLRSVYPDAELHVAAYLADEAVMLAKAAPGGRDDRGADQWYAGLTHRLRRSDAKPRTGWLTFRWAPISF